MELNENKINMSENWLNACSHHLKRLGQDSSLWLKLVIILGVVFLIVNQFKQNQTTNEESKHYINSPKVNDIYFLDFRLLSDALRPNEKYRLAKVVDITGDIVTLQYGNLFYLRQQALKDSIRYGQLRYRKYFATKRYDFTSNQIKHMWHTGAIYLVKRPILDKLFGNYVSPDKVHHSSDFFVPGRRENASATSFLKSNHIENNLSQAYNLYFQSAQLGFAKGQVNLAQMFLNGQHVEQDLSQALHWFNQAALQSHKPGILKYVIVCEQVPACNVADFYQSLIDAGVNIKVRSMDVKLSTSLN
ncbi:hypothetical protein NBRC116592_00200 [Colwellia sp. KU-HH00111]|uniref:tetratricopeptide repeat protein n=1 Tax=Colwellia sp. KU-HH00111 TaxID=3127652 RepID=UPI0031029227